MTGYWHALIDVVRPDFPGDVAVRVIAHRGDVRFVGVEIMSGSTEVVALQLDAEQARVLGESLRIAAEKMV
ncbi:hypothetical protein [Dietzia maris]|uniref:Uncharacterized protein n=1 Tax=Dietzia maris TaxID=37915 RepID=A0ABT8GZ45_9ACTN|nr:hypothetical protein [Dietzia maris]MCZ4539853.1 hypothetical protein [Dietzia maris]MDN4505307.1 hypothetical protein [Dietzia maris]